VVGCMNELCLHLSSRAPNGERCDIISWCALVGGMHEASNADWWDARMTRQLTPLSHYLLPEKTLSIPGSSRKSETAL